MDFFIVLGPNPLLALRIMRIVSTAFKTMCVCVGSMAFDFKIPVDDICTGQNGILVVRYLILACVFYLLNYDSKEKLLL